MNASEQQIVSSFEDSSLTPEEISSELQFDMNDVKEALVRFSPKYREANPEEAKRLAEMFSQQDEEMAKQAMKTCLYDESGAVKFRAAQYILDERKGRHDLKKEDKNGGGINILIIQQRLENAKAAKERARQIGAANPVAPSTILQEPITIS